MGRATPRLAVRLIRLMTGGNRYEAAITSASETELSIIIREIVPEPGADGDNLLPWPGSSRDSRSYCGDSVLAQYDVVDDEEPDEVGVSSYSASGWDESDDAPDPSTIKPRPLGIPAGEPERDPEDEDEG